jgi:hypothetical protein
MNKKNNTNPTNHSGDFIIGFFIKGLSTATISGK